MAATASSSSSSSHTQIENAEPLSEIVCPVPTSAQPHHYQVFINHRGPDVKKTLANHIYHTLQEKGIRAFFDKDEMERGELMSAQIKDAIRSSSVHIAIFSQNYAESRWCLDELCLMMEHPEKVLPVFYHVEPSDLRRLEKDKDGPYAKAMRVHENKGRYNSQTIEKWKQTLIDVAAISGYELEQFNGFEGDLVKQIVDDVSGRVKREQWYVAKYPVGLNEMAEEFEQKMWRANRDHNENVNVVGIVGMGGRGKTTLATHIFNIKRSIYDRSCFLAEVRSHNSVTDLQSILLKDLTGSNERIHSVRQGIGILRDRLSSCHALIILDDVDREEHLEALLVVREVLQRGSSIVVTSRNKDVLERSGISRLYKMEKLGNQHALELFCRHAFGRSFPAEGFEDLVESFLKVCDGLPLSLKVLGALLHGNDNKDYWQSQRGKISQKMPADISKTLKISYDALEENEREIYLDIVSFFIGEDKDMAIRIWDGCGWYGLIGLQTLEQRCLVEFDYRGRIKMHDHVRDLGRDIIDEEASKHPQKPRRLWRPKDIDDLLQRRSGTMGFIRGIKMSDDLRRSSPGDDRILRHSFTGVSGLELLDIEGEPPKGILGSSSTDIRWLRWRRCPYEPLPSWLPMDKLTVLEIDNCGDTWWDGLEKFPAQLREFHANRLSRWPKSIGDLKRLEKIVVGYSPIQSLPEEFCRLQSLKHLALRYWNDLEVLPENFGDLTNLQHLELFGCQALRELPRSFGGSIHLRYLSVASCNYVSVPTDILGNISTLEFVDFSTTFKIEVLPSQITHQTSLQEIHLLDTRLKELPDDIGELSALKILRLESEALTTLPPGIWTLTNLTTLHLQICRRLKSLGYPECGVSVMSSSGVESFRGGVQQLKNLEYLKIWDCPLGEVLPFTNGRAVDEEESMVGLTHSGGRLPKLHSLILMKTEICKISISEDVCPNLKLVDLRKNHHLVEIEALPNTIEVLDIRANMNLKEVPNVGGFSALERLDTRGSPKLNRVEGLEQLKRCRFLQGELVCNQAWNK